MNEELIATEEELHRNYRALQDREQELLESRENFQVVLENSIVAIYKRNYLTDTYDYVSPSITAINGYSPEETMTFSQERVTSAVHPDDQPLLTRTVEEIISRGGREWQP